MTMSMVVLRVAIMAIVTYLLRVAPFCCLRNRSRIADAVIFIPCTLRRIDGNDCARYVSRSGKRGGWHCGIYCCCNSRLVSSQFADCCNGSVATVWVVNAMITSGWSIDSPKASFNNVEICTLL